MIYNKFINCATLDIFNSRKEAGDIIDQHIVFIEDVKQIWSNGVFYAANEIDPGDIEKLNEILDKIQIDGSGNKFLADNGEYKSVDSMSVGTAAKLGTSTVGSGTIPMYLNQGSPVASNSNVGSSGRPVYLDNGSITQCSDTLGVNISGKANTAGTADNATSADTASKLGSSNVGNASKPIYLSSGSPTESNATVGSSSKPVYLNSGTITECSGTLGVNISGNASTADYVNRDRGSNTVSSLTSLPINKRLVVATLSEATSISLSSDMNVGEDMTIICNPSASFTQPMPSSGNYMSMDGDSLDVSSGKAFELNIYCYETGKYSISSKVKY